MHRPVSDTITTVYDMASRVLSRDYRLKANSPSGTIADQDTFTYDSSSRMLTGISGRYSNTVTNTFDNAGRFSTESLAIGGQTYTVTSEYDLRGMRKKVNYPNSSTWERTYTARRQLYETKYNGSTIDTRAYDDGGRLDTSTYANGVTADYNWRPDNLLADIGFSHPVGVAANRRIGTYTYAWDANKNKTKETITGQIPGYSFDTTLGTDPDGYDDEDRLTYFKRQSTTNPQTWDLSLVGDWNSWSNFGTAQSRTHDPAHEILTAGNTPNNAFSHDVKGNMTDIPSNILSPARKLFWDFDNQLTGVDTTGDSTPEVTYEYDALHRRVARIEGSNSKVYIHSSNQIIADYNRGSAANTTPAFRYVWGDYIDEPILRQTGSTTILYYHRNQQYSTIALTNTSGEVVERYGYMAYGQMTVMNYLGNVRSWSDWSNRLTYTGREWDDATKLFHFRARWYEPVAGRFVSRDPLGYVDGTSSYEANFVPSLVDPFGLICCERGSYVDIAVKSYIASLEGTGVGQGRKRGWSDAQIVALGLFMAATEAGFSENPKDGDFRFSLDARLYSKTRVYFTWDCNGFARVNFRLIEAAVGTEPADTSFPLGVGESKGPDNIISQGVPGSFKIQWRFAGRPDVIAEPIFQAVRHRDAVFIWHQVTVTGTLLAGRPFINVRLLNSEFPSHRVWIRHFPSKAWGAPVIQHNQLHITNLWDSATFDKTYVE